MVAVRISKESNIVGLTSIEGSLFSSKLILVMEQMSVDECFCRVTVKCMSLSHSVSSSHQLVTSMWRQC